MPEKESFHLTESKEPEIFQRKKRCRIDKGSKCEENLYVDDKSFSHRYITLIWCDENLNQPINIQFADDMKQTQKKCFVN